MGREGRGGPTGQCFWPSHLLVLATHLSPELHIKCDPAHSIALEMCNAAQLAFYIQYVYSIYTVYLLLKGHTQSGGVLVREAARLYFFGEWENFAAICQISSTVVGDQIVFRWRFTVPESLNQLIQSPPG